MKTITYTDIFGEEVTLTKFTNTELFFLECNIKRGEPVTDEERSAVERYQREREQRRESELRFMREGGMRSKRNKHNAIASAMEKYCPSIKKNCIGQKCAMFKVFEVPKDFNDKDKWATDYDAMCGYNTPERGSHIVR